MNPNISPDLLQKIVVAIHDLSESQIEKILNDQACLRISVVTNRTKSVVGPAAEHVEECLQKLRQAGSREVGTEVLSGINKKLLEAVAKKLDLSIDSSITKDRLIDRIVERAVGLRLRQDAFARLD